jgi:D-glycero-alpha-D-manno-heptose-7-phosphate kinase
MIITRTPYRISFFGGGTDFPQWYENYGGSVISTAINHYSYIVLKKLPKIFSYNYRVRYVKREECKFISQIQHPVVRNVLTYKKVNEPLDITHFGDLPARTGIGSSSSFTVGFLNALTCLQGKYIGKRALAAEAIYVEQKLLKESVGSQDQVAAAFGGFNKIDFNLNGSFVCNNINLSYKNLRQFQSWLQFFFTGISRDSNAIEKTKIKNIHNNKEIFSEINNITREAEKIFSKNKKNIFFELGELLDYQWTVKKKLSSKVSTNNIDIIYQKAKKNGAVGGKICGAGNGGFFIFITPPKFHEKVRRSIGLPSVPIDFDLTGSQLIYNTYQ